MRSEENSRLLALFAEAREWGLALERERDETAANAVALNDALAAARAAEREANAAVEVLSVERDQLRSHCQRLAGEVASAHRNIWELSEELDRLRRWMFAPPGHFFSPIVDPRSEQVRRVCTGMESRFERGCAGVELNESVMLELLRRLAVHWRDLPFAESAVPGLRYRYDNDAFSHGDALAYAGLLREFQPRRVIEVGGGFSTALLMDVNDLFLDRSAAIHVVEPYPETLLSLLDPSDAYREAIIAKPLQDVELDLFVTLEENDILFIDSSHVGKTGSDVTDYLFRILPALKPGVLVHIHDIFYPFEYPPEWIMEQNRSWNEAYLVHAFLHANPEFEALFFCDLVYSKHADVAAELLPAGLKGVGGSLWLRRLTRRARTA
jgi:hypothetical protein